MTETYLIIENGVVTNRVVWDGNTSTWQPPEAANVMPAVDGVGIGWTFAGGVFSPASQAAEVKRYFTYKGDIWRRVTEEEARELDGDLTALPVRLRRLWDDSSQVNHDDEYGQLLIQTMTDRWGAHRASVVMAPSGEI